MTSQYADVFTKGLPTSVFQEFRSSLNGLGLQVVNNVDDAEFILAHGTLAAKYESLGGEVKWMGKPDKVIYTSAMSLAGVDAHECIMVGDSLHYDIKGANASGIASAFITGGIHSDELGLVEFGETAGEDAINSLCSKHGSYPSYVLPSFTW
ncbi:uncharacterized protein [Miscanthus floridulus]|uniref:uncharacterized protein n=1 Tax=Miscanthus floridulus TaxID=154761 RepID=UPI00345A31B0